MDKNEFLQAIREIGTCEDDVIRRDKLNDLQNNISSIFDENLSLTERNTSLTADNETLRSANMKLFLQVGSDDTDEPNTPKPSEEEKPKEKRKFEDLFNEKGELK